LHGEEGNENGPDEEPETVLISSSSLLVTFAGIVDADRASWCITVVIDKG
jgi:hypothetical protein